MEESIILLTTMSPKIKVLRKLPRKLPSKLALKKNIRKSMILNNSKVEESIITIDTSISTEGEDKIVKDTIKDENVFNTEICAQFSTKLKCTEDNQSPTRKYNDIKRWVTDVNSKTIFQGSPDNFKCTIQDNNEAEGNELSSIINTGKVHLKTKFQSIFNYEDGKNTFVESNNSQQKNIFLSNQSYKLENKFSSCGNNSDIINDNKNTINETNQISISISSHRNNLLQEIKDCSISDTSIDLFLSRIKRRSKKTSEFASDVISNSDDDNILENRIKMRNENNILIIDDSFNGSLVDEASKKQNLSNSGNENCHKEKFDILDNLYGDTWRQNQELVLSNVKPKPKKITTKSLKVDRKISLLHKNPYVPTEKIKSDQILKSLQRERKKKISTQSPWVNRLKDLCDSETSSENSLNSKNYLPKRLDFNDSNSSMSDTDAVKKASETDTIEKNLEDKDIILPNEQKEKPGNYIKVIRATEISQSNNSSMVNKPLSQYRKTTKEKETFSFLASLSGNVPINKCDMTARIFRSNFKTHRNELTSRLFQLYNKNIFMNAIPEDTNIQWSERMRHTAGVCSCIKTTRKTGVIERRVRITLSTKVLDSADRLRDTLVHEMCHAATWIVNQLAGGHGPQWQSWTQKARTVFPELPPINRCHDYEIHSKYTYRCISCGYSIARHTKSLDIERKRCGHCYGKFEILINRINKRGEKKTVPIQSKKTVNGFALFVKENYANFKSPKLKHGEVMKMLGQKFTELKV